MSLNLLPSEAKFQAQRMHLKAIISNFLWIIGGIWILLILITFGTGFFLNFRVTKLNEKYQTKLNDYKGLIEEVALTQKIKYQAKVVAKVLDSRFEYGNAMSLASRLFSDDVKIDDIQIGKNRVFKISGGMNSGEAIDEVELKVAKINAGEVEGFSSAKLTSIEVNKAKGWSFSVELDLK